MAGAGTCGGLTHRPAWPIVGHMTNQPQRPPSATIELTHREISELLWIAQRAPYGDPELRSAIDKLKTAKKGLS